jgi:hypothetical protein
MEPNERQPALARASMRRSGSRRPWRNWRFWAPFVPSVFYIAGLIFQVRLSSTVSQLLGLMVYVYFGILLAPTARALFRANPGIWRTRVVRRVLAGGTVSISAMCGLVIAVAISGQTIGPVQIVLLVIAFGSMALVLVATFIGLLDASKDVVDCYRAEHSAPPPLS